jgi:hypothetical protein
MATFIRIKPDKIQKIELWVQTIEKKPARHKIHSKKFQKKKFLDKILTVFFFWIKLKCL